MVFRDDFFPEAFSNAASAVWGLRAVDFLNGIQSSATLAKEQSVIAARTWLSSEKLSSVFLAESGLKSVLGAIGYQGKLVDLIAEAPSKRLILLEAKSVLTSAQLRRSFHGVSKFENSARALRKFYERGRQPFPGVEELLITAREIRISGRSSWSITKNGHLSKTELEVLFENLPVVIHKIAF